MSARSQALVPLSAEQQATWRAVAETEKRRHQGNLLAEYPYAGAFFRCLNGSRRMSLSDLRFFMPSLTAEELRGNRSQWLYAVDVLIETQGEVCLLPLPGDAAERLFPSVRFRVRERSRHKSALVMQKYSRQQAREAMTDLCQYVDVCISNEEDAKDVFGIEAEATDIYAGEINREGYKSVARQLADRFGFEKVAITLRESRSASDNGWSAMLFDAVGDEYHFSKKYDLHIVDRVGGDDSFGGGLIYALLAGKGNQRAVEFAVAASALKHTVEGDYNMVTAAEVEKLADGDGSGRIQR